MSKSIFNVEFVNEPMIPEGEDLSDWVYVVHYRLQGTGPCSHIPADHIIVFGDVEVDGYEWFDAICSEGSEELVDAVTDPIHSGWVRLEEATQIWNARWSENAKEVAGLTLDPECIKGLLDYSPSATQ